MLSCGGSGFAELDWWCGLILNMELCSWETGSAFPVVMSWPGSGGRRRITHRGVFCQLGRVAGAPLGTVVLGPCPASSAMAEAGRAERKALASAVARAAEVRALGEKEPQWQLVREYEWELLLLLLLPLEPEWTGREELRVLELPSQLLMAWQPEWPKPLFPMHTAP